MLKYLPLLHDAHAAVLCVGQAVPLAAVPPEHVQTLVLHTRLRVVVGDVDWYWELEHTVQAGHAPLLKYLPLVQDAHLAVLCVGQAVPVAPVPPEQVQTLFLHTRLRVVVGEVDWY